MSINPRNRLPLLPLSIPRQTQRIQRIINIRRRQSRRRTHKQLVQPPLLDSFLVFHLRAYSRFGRQGSPFSFFKG
jgi:hypothetical protein